MKKIIVASLLILSVILACNSSRQKGLILQKPGDLPPDEYVIDTDKDTTLVTKNGALLKIPKGALQNSNGSSVTLEIKEAYTAEQMIRAGLTTRSNGELLSSGGMIYINAKAGQEVKITQAIKVALPSGNLDTGMQLFKGEPDDQGNINWVDPAPLPENPQLKNIDRGKQLFMSNCASCHSIGKESTGPNLAHYLKRYSGDTLLVRGYALHGLYPGEGGLYPMHNSDTAKYNALHYKLEHIDDALWENQFLYFCNLRSRYGSLGTPFPNLTEADLTAIYQYIQNESVRQNLPVPADLVSNDCIDSCRNYLKLKWELEEQREKARVKKDNLVKEKVEMTEEYRKEDTTGSQNPSPVTSSVPPSTPPPPVRFEDIVEPDNKESLYYQFSIETFGWYNVDVLIKEWNGSQESTLSVRIMGEYREKAEVFLIIPSGKIYTKGGKKKTDPAQLVFGYDDGTIFLPQGTTAYILAVSETESSVAFSLKQFTTGLKQEFEISLQTASKEEFSQAIKVVNANGFTITVKDTKNAGEIRKTNLDIKNIDSAIKNAEKLKPKNCDCDCIMGDAVDAKPIAVEIGKATASAAPLPK